METRTRCLRCGPSESVFFTLLIKSFAIQRLSSHGLSLNMKRSIFSFPFQTIRVGCIGEFYKTSLKLSLFPISSGVVYDLFITKIIVRNEVSNLVFSSHFLRALHCELSAIFCPFCWSKMSKPSCDLFLRQYAFNLQKPFWWILLSNAKSCHTDAKFGQWLIAIHVAITIDGRLLKYVNACFCLSRNIHFIQKSRKIVLRNKEFRPWSNIQQKHVISQNTPEILWSFKIWTRMSGFSFFYTFFLKWLPEIASRLVHNGGWRQPILQWVRPVLHGKHVQCHFLNVHLFWFELFLTWISNGVIGFRSSVSATNRSPPHDGLVCRTDALNIGLGTCKMENYFCSKEWSAHQMVNWSDVHKMSGHLQENLSHFEYCNTTPLLLPTNFPKAKSNPIRTKFLLSNVVQLALQFYVFRICAEWIPHKSDSASRKLFEIPENCSYNWLSDFLLEKFRILLIIPWADAVLLG